MAMSPNVAALFAFLAAPGLLLAQGVPLGHEFRVNSYTTSSQLFPSVAFDGAGNFVVAWASPDHGSGHGVFAQRYASTGAPLGAEFRVSTYTTRNQYSPTVGSVSSDSAGNFVIVWVSDYGDGANWDVFGQRYASTGVPLGVAFRVNTYTSAGQLAPAVASDSAGNFVIVWWSIWGVFAQRYASTGAPLGGEFQVSTYTTSGIRIPSVAADSAGNFVVAYESDTQDGAGDGIFAQRYASTGAPLGGEFQVNTYTTSHQRRPSLASDPAGNFVIAWDSDTQDGTGHGIFAQRYASTGAPLGGEFQVNTYTTNNQRFPSVASDAAGNFVITWASLQDPSYGIFAQRYASTGAPLGGEFRVNSYVNDTQHTPAVASDFAGNFVVAWQSYLQDGSSDGVYAQRYNMILPVELQSFRVE